ncbi:hypothetical protein ABTH77_20560, partial [Acinetobacter baumannii]
LDAKKAEYHEFSLKLATIDSQVDACTASIRAATEAIESLAELKDGEECPVCHGVVGKENDHHIAEHQEAQRAKHQAELKAH